MTAKRGFIWEGGLPSAREKRRFKRTLYVGVKDRGREGCDD
jgi:hypothetical protein